MSRYRFIEAEKHQHAISLLCRVLEVSRAAYYRWKACPLSPRVAANLVLLEKIRTAHADSDGKYGSPRIYAELQDQGVRASRGRIARLMAASGIVGHRGRRRVRTTIPAKKPAPFADLVKRRFKAAKPNELWCGDLTYVHTGEGFLYLASVIDVFSRRVIGWAIATHMRAELVMDALRMAVANRGGQVRGVVFHSDRGAQYGAGTYQDLARSTGVRQSMGRVADCFDKALASHCTSWRWFGGDSFGEPTAHALDEPGIARSCRFEEAFVLVVGLVGDEQSRSGPRFDRARVDAEAGGHLVPGEQALGAQALGMAREPVITA